MLCGPPPAFEGEPDPVVSEVSFCRPVPCGSSVVFVSGWFRVAVGV